MALGGHVGRRSHVDAPGLIEGLKDPGSGGAGRRPPDFLLPPISLAVCTRARPRDLERCLRSLSRLDYPIYDVIVVDNEPRDDATRAIVSASAFRYVPEDRPGLTWARNRAAAEARHDIIAFVDDDVEVSSGWLRGLARSFAEPEVAAVTGLVLPMEVETPAQRLFESYGGGMSKGRQPKRFEPARMKPAGLLAAQKLGVGANMAFRRKILQDLGGFDTALGVGTPAGGGDDLDIFHRLLAAGFTLQYDPAALVWHLHRRDMEALWRQIFQNGQSYGVYLIKRFRRGEVNRARVAAFALAHWGSWLMGRLLLGLMGLHPLPLSLLWAEIRGALNAPRAYLLTYRRDREMREQDPRLRA